VIIKRFCVKTMWGQRHLVKSKVMEAVIDFLKRNGFKEIELNSFVNDRGCDVFIGYKGYAVANSEGDVMYSQDLNIYWLVGVLTWRGFIDKNYK